LDLLLGVIGSVINIDFDIGGHHIGDMFDADLNDAGDAVGPLPFNIMCLCFSLVVFGAIGKLISEFMINILATIGCMIALVAISVFSYRLLYKYIVKPLKTNNPKAIKEWDLFANKGRLTLRIAHDSPGVVSLKDSTGAMISYRAYAKNEVLENWEGEIPAGIEVMVVDIDLDSKMAYIKPLDTLQNFQIKNNKEN
jgi:hypothetical protein